MRRLSVTLKKKIVIAVFLVAVVVITGLLVRAWFYAAEKVSRPDKYREYITKTVSEKLKRSVTYDTGTATLTLRDGLFMQFANLVIRDKDGSTDFLQVDKARVRINILPLLRNRLVFGEIVLHQPRIFLKRDSSGVLNIDDLLKREEDKKAPKFRKIIIENGSVAFVDQYTSNGELLTSLETINGKLNALFWTDRYRFHFTTHVIENKNKAKLALDGFYNPAPAEKPVYESKIRTSIHMEGTDLKHYIPYLRKYTPIRKIAGKLNVDMFFSGKFSDFKSKGTFIIKNPSLYYPGVFSSVVQPRLIQVNYSLKRDSDNLNLNIVDLAVDDFHAKGSFEIDDLDKKDPMLKASAVTKVFSFKEVKPYVPWGIIHDDVSGFIQDHIKDGRFRLVEGKLKGRISQLADMYGKESIDVVSIRAEVEKGVFAFNSTTPAFHDINGILELKEREFSLKKMNGRFGNAPCTMEGKISDFARPQKNIYTASMKIQPSRDEVLWLLGKEKFRDSSFKGTSMLFLSGKGTDEEYHINASWDLFDVAYAYSDVLEKSKSRKNHIHAKIVINDDAVNVTSFKYYLPPVNINASARFRFAGDIPLSFNIQSGVFDMRDAVPLLPVLRKFEPAGNCSLAIAGRGDLSRPASIDWSGNISLVNFSFQPLKEATPLTAVTGKVFFKGNSVETSLLKGKMGDSSVQGNFKIDDLSHPRVICQLSTNLLQTKDLGLQSSHGDFNLYAVKAQIGIQDEIIQMDSLSFVLGKSSFNMTGEIHDWENPKVKVELSSPYMELEDLRRFVSLEYPQKEKKASSAMELNATLNVSDGKLDEIDFKKLYAGLKYTRGMLDVEALEADIFDGKVTAGGQVNMNADGSNHYKTNLSVSKMSLEKIQGYLNLGERNITGRLSLSGDLTTSGRDAGELQKNAEGTFEVRAEKGVLKRFSVLSKIFSILNVFQLAKLQLPDMAKGGMPYKKITFHTSIKNGILSSKDFFMDSNAIQFSGTGNIDYINKRLDYIIGVHPLQTLDLIAARIPIAGWIITDERGKLITFNFKVGGSWDNPEVTTITTESIGKGTLDVFRRIFMLPEKLVTDTGEVILGR